MEAVNLGVVSGRLQAINEDRISIQLRSGQICSYPYNGIGDAGLEIDLQWLFENMGHPVVCQIEDGVIIEIKPIGSCL